ncbi:hypothetical protein QYF36_002196 [Acer negundo]|nr:hypothetical protein QYF36_002196 [Acer negundo]
MITILYDSNDSIFFLDKKRFEPYYQKKGASNLSKSFVQVYNDLAYVLGCDQNDILGKGAKQRTEDHLSIIFGKAVCIRNEWLVNSTFFQQNAKSRAVAISNLKRKDKGKKEMEIPVSVSPRRELSKQDTGMRRETERCLVRAEYENQEEGLEEDEMLRAQRYDAFEFDEKRTTQDHEDILVSVSIVNEVVFSNSRRNLANHPKGRRGWKRLYSSK